MNLIGINELLQFVALDQLFRLLVEAEQCLNTLDDVFLFEIHSNQLMTITSISTQHISNIMIPRSHPIKILFSCIFLKVALPSISNKISNFVVVYLNYMKSKTASQLVTAFVETKQNMELEADKRKFSEFQETIKTRAKKVKG